jgi:hypothetical protein
VSRSNAVIGLLAVCAGAVLACDAGSSRAGGEEEERPEYRDLTQRFGEAVLRGDWAAAYAMTTATFHGAVGQAQLQAQYENLLREIREDEPGFQPNRVIADFGVLPSNETEAKETYDILMVPPQATWKAWTAAGIGFGDDQGIVQGIDARLLIVDDGGQLKIGWVRFEFMD